MCLKFGLNWRDLVPTLAKQRPLSAFSQTCRKHEYDAILVPHERERHLRDDQGCFRSGCALDAIMWYGLVSPNSGVPALPNPDRITFNPKQCGGRACIQGMRIRVVDVLDMLAGGATRSEILADSPYLEDADITAALDYAARSLEGRVVIAAE